METDHALMGRSLPNLSLNKELSLGDPFCSVSETIKHTCQSLKNTLNIKRRMIRIAMSL